MLDVVVAYNRYKFLGYEFLTWLWFIMETDPNKLRNIQPELLELNIGNRLVLENRQSGAVESITIKGDEAGLEEGRLALNKGAMVSEINVAYRSGDHKWQFSLKGESLNISTLKVPETSPVESENEFEGALLEKIYLHDKAISLLEGIYQQFIKTRVSNVWIDQVVPNMKKWIKNAPRKDSR